MRRRGWQHSPFRSQHSFNARFTLLSCSNRAISGLKADEEATGVSACAKGVGTAKSPEATRLEMISDSGWKDDVEDV